MVNGGRRCKHCIHHSDRYVVYNKIFCTLYEKMVKLDFAERCKEYYTADMRYAELKMQVRLPYLHDWMILEAIDACKNPIGPTAAEIWNRIRFTSPTIYAIVQANPDGQSVTYLYWGHVKDKCNEMVQRGILRRSYRFGSNITYSHYSLIDEWKGKL